MNINTVKKLHCGDEIELIDSDDSECGEFFVIQDIEICGDIVKITDKNGDVLECHAYELR